MTPDSGEGRSAASLSFRQRYAERREFDADASWHEWLRERFAKFAYGVGCFVLDLLVVGVILQGMDRSQIWPYLISTVLLVGVAIVEFRGAWKFSPPNSPERASFHEALCQIGGRSSDTFK